MAPSAAAAQREEICLDVGLSLAKPAVAEWTYWIGVGGGWGALGEAGEHADLVLRAGGGVDFELGRIGDERRYGGPVEIRSGPWVGLDATFGEGVLEPGVALEGGLSLDIGQTSHAQWGDYSLRVGAGAVWYAAGWRPAGSLTLMWGVRSVLDRYIEGGACVSGDGRGYVSVDEGRPRSDHALASGIRIFGTLRVDGEASYTLIFGVELEPTFFLPPYSGARWIGARP